jgi:hypothetical protein
MNLATLAQSQSLATLLQALAPASGLVAGRTVEARLLALAGDGTATAQLGQETFSLVLSGPIAKQAALQPGATLVLRLDPAPASGRTPAALQATLVEVRPPPAAGPQATPSALPASGGEAPAGAQPSPSTPSPAVLSAAATRPAAAGAAVPASGSNQPATPAATPAARPAGPAASVASQGLSPRPAPVAATAASPLADPPAAPQAASPRAQAGPLLGPALAGQDSLAPLLANMRALSAGTVALALPRPVLTLIERVLGQALPIDHRPLTAPMLKAAVQGSGLFLEARQAEGRAPPPQGDLKANLQILRDSLAPLAQALSPPETALPARTGRPLPADLLPLPTGEPAAKPPPPRRDGPLVPPPLAEASLGGGDTPLNVVRTLLEQTESALDRITLSQYASLPAEGPRAEAPQPQRWLTELPLALQQGATMLPLQIEKEPPRREVDAAAGPLWRVRFALDVEPLGPLQGVVTLQGRSVGITLWAEREDTSRVLRGAAPGLEAALAEARFENRAIDIHTGQPRIAQPTAGQFLDRLS